ncbi:MAG: hypothetical protein JKY62_05375 [Desulfocapsa sp.]|nr:hypothetical protein [Desulfocapsa sp.]
MAGAPLRDGAIRDDQIVLSYYWQSKYERLEQAEQRISSGTQQIAGVLILTIMSARSKNTWMLSMKAALPKMTVCQAPSLTTTCPEQVVMLCSLMGALGNDNFVFSAGDGHDIITDANAEDTILIHGTTSKDDRKNCRILTKIVKR